MIKRLLSSGLVLLALERGIERAGGNPGLLGCCIGRHALADERNGRLCFRFFHSRSDLGFLLAEV